jgi:hypothetical protein
MGAAQLLDESDYQRLAELRYRLRGFLKFSEHEAAKIGLNPQQHQALLAIKGTPGGHVTIGILAERLGIRHNSAVELIDRLIKNSLAERRQNPRDRREVHRNEGQLRPMANVTMPNTALRKIVVTVPNAYKIADHALSTKICGREIMDTPMTSGQRGF